MEISSSINTKMSSDSSAIDSNEFNVEDLVWARRDHDGIYWPGKINLISNNLTDTVLMNNNLHQYQTCSYLIQFFGYNQTHWTVDVLPYRQYRDYMSKNLLMHYETYPQIKYQFLGAIKQADYAIVKDNSNSNKSINSSSFKNNFNGNYTSTSNSIVAVCRNSTPPTTDEYLFNHYSQSSYTYPQYISNCSYNAQLSTDSYCSCCVQPSFSSTNSLAPLSDEYRSLQNATVTPQTGTSQKTNSMIIITTKTFSNSSFISYLFNCFSHFPHHSIIYLDDPINNYQHSTTSNISYLICLDHFDSTIKQTLNSTILNNLTAHVNYLFLLVNAPSHELVKHFYSIVMDQRTIVVLQYHSTFDNEPLLLCSGNRTTYEMIRWTLLKYLCSKVKYIESEGDGEEQFYSTNDVPLGYQPNNIKSEPVIDIPDQTLISNSLINYPNPSTDYLAVRSIRKHSKKIGRRKLIKTLERRALKRKLKNRLPKNGILSGSSSEYHVQNILDTCNSSK